MDHAEETLGATVDASGQLHLSQPSRLPPGAVTVTIRPVSASAKRGLADVLQEIAADQRSRGYAGRATDEILADDASRQDDNERRDAQLTSARRTGSPGAP